MSLTSRFLALSSPDMITGSVSDCMCCLSTVSSAGTLFPSSVAYVPSKVMDRFCVSVHPHQISRAACTLPGVPSLRTLSDLKRRKVCSVLSAMAEEGTMRLQR